MLKTNLTTILLCLGLAGYMSATDGIYGETPSCRQKAQEIEFVVPFPDYHLSTGWSVQSDYFASRVALSAHTLIDVAAGRMWPSQAGFLLNDLRPILDYLVKMITTIEIYSYLNPQQSQFPMLERLKMRQHSRGRKLDWLAISSLFKNDSPKGEDNSEWIDATSMLYSVGLYVVDFCFNYFLQSRIAMMLPQLRWGEIAYTPYIWICDRNSGKREQYILDSILDYILLHILLYILDYFAESSESFAASQLLKELKDQCSAKQTAFYEYFNRVKQAALESWPCEWILNLGSYLRYRDKTALIVLGAYKDQYSLFCATDRLWTYRGHAVDIEAGIGLKYKSNGGKELLGLFGLQGTFRLHECCSLKVAVSRKTPGFIEGITASGDGWTLSGGVTLHI